MCGFVRCKEAFKENCAPGSEYLVCWWLAGGATNCTACLHLLRVSKTPPTALQVGAKLREERVSAGGFRANDGQELERLLGQAPAKLGRRRHEPIPKGQNRVFKKVEEREREKTIHSFGS